MEGFYWRSRSRSHVRGALSSSYQTTARDSQPRLRGSGLSDCLSGACMPPSTLQTAGGARPSEIRRGNTNPTPTWRSRGRYREAETAVPRAPRQQPHITPRGTIGSLATGTFRGSPAETTSSGDLKLVSGGLAWPCLVGPGLAEPYPALQPYPPTCRAPRISRPALTRTWAPRSAGS